MIHSWGSQPFHHQETFVWLFGLFPSDASHSLKTLGLPSELQLLSNNYFISQAPPNLKEIKDVHNYQIEFCFKAEKVDVSLAQNKCMSSVKISVMLTICKPQSLTAKKPLDWGNSKPLCMQMTWDLFRCRFWLSGSVMGPENLHFWQKCPDAADAAGALTTLWDVKLQIIRESKEGIGSQDAVQSHLQGRAVKHLLYARPMRTPCTFLYAIY